MEVIVLDVARALGGEGTFVELKVRKNEFDYDYYVFPKHVVEKTIICLKRSDIYCDDVSADMEEIQNLPIEESKYSVEEYDEADCVAVHSDIDINELYEIIEYINMHPDYKISIVLYKNSELPEFMDLLSDKAKKECTIEIQAVLSSYMRLLLDMSVSDLARTIIDYGETASFGKLLNMYTEDAIEYICNHVTKRFETELREEMLKG